MRKIFVILFAIMIATPSYSQDSTRKKKKFELTKRAADHFMFQFATFNIWTKAPDSITNYIQGFQRSANVYVMLDKIITKDQRFSIAGGIGVGTTNIYFDDMLVDLASSTSLTLRFIAADTTLNYKKYKVSSTFLEIPLELRFSSNPETPNKSFKGAIGVKFGTLLSAKNKGKTLLSANGATINEKTEKEISKRYFNEFRSSITGRVGYGVFGVFAAYDLTETFKGLVAPSINALQIGVYISGL